MRHVVRIILLSLLIPGFNAVTAEKISITVYNNDFAVVREKVPLELEKGVNHVSHSGLPAHLEPESVMLRDPAGKAEFSILEQNYWSEPLSQELLLSHFEGKEIEVETEGPDGSPVIKPMRIIRSGYVTHRQTPYRFNSDYAQRQRFMSQRGGQTIVEVDGRIRFGMPGEPLFPALPEKALIEPTLYWTMASASEQQLESELSYITGGMSWKADYNLVLPEKGDTMTLSGWVTMNNQCGRDFKNASIRLMAGEVSKIDPDKDQSLRQISKDRMAISDLMKRPVEEKAIDEYHLYNLNLPSTLKDRETKQVEFVICGNIRSESFYLYKGGYAPREKYQNFNFIDDKNYGMQENTKIWVMREFRNTKENNLGIPLPAGKLRFYRSSGSGLEFTGENLIDHTPEGETVRVYTGNAFDLTGTRRQTDYVRKYDRGEAGNQLDESFEIILANHKKEAVEIRVIEELYRGRNWEITESSDLYKKIDYRNIEFRVAVDPGSRKTITYSVHYTW